MGILRRCFRVLLTLPPMWVLVLNSLLLTQVGVAEGHTKAIVQCKKNIPYERAVKVGPDQYVESTGLLAEHYDTNGDGVVDIVTLSHSDGVSGHKPNPVFWIVDVDKDGYPDAIYVDKKGLGKCKDIVLYEDLSNVSQETDQSRNGRRT